MENYVKYSLFKYIKINNADPISSLFLSDNYVIIGTMFGRVILASLTNEKEITFSFFHFSNPSLRLKLKYNIA